MTYKFIGTSNPLIANWGIPLASLLFIVMIAACRDSGGSTEIVKGTGPQAFQSETDTTMPVFGKLLTFAGTGSPKFKGDGGNATEAGLFAPSGVALDQGGNLYVSSDRRIRRVDAASGIITTVAGSGSSLILGDNGPAIEAGLREARGIAVGASGDIFIADNGSGRIRKIEAATGVITTVAGGGSGNLMDQVYGDGEIATEALVRVPDDVSLDANGNLYIATNNRIRKVDSVTGIINTIAGTGERGLDGDNGLATKAMFAEPVSIAIDGQANIFVADRDNHRIRKIDGTTGIVSTIAGIGKSFERTPYFYTGSVRLPQAATAASGAGYAGDGGPAVQATLQVPSGVALDEIGNLFIADGGIHLRMVHATTGIISTVAGGQQETSYETGKIQVHTGVVGEFGHIAINSQGHVFLSDRKNNLVHMVSFTKAPTGYQ